MTKRFKDTGDTVYSFLDETLVVCPECGGRAVTRRIDAAATDWFAPRRLMCTDCACMREWAKGSIARLWRQGFDDYFQCPLWLQTPCRGEVLWAYNARHLDFIEGLVAAKLRERVRDPEDGWSNRSFASRLPRWIKSAKHRDEVLKAVARLRARLEAGSARGA